MLFHTESGFCFLLLLHSMRKQPKERPAPEELMVSKSSGFSLQHKQEKFCWFMTCRSLLGVFFLHKLTNIKSKFCFQLWQPADVGVMHISFYLGFRIITVVMGHILFERSLDQSKMLSVLGITQISSLIYWIISSFKNFF